MSTNSSTSGSLRPKSASSKELKMPSSQKATAKKSNANRTGTPSKASAINKASSASTKAPAGSKGRRKKARKPLTKKKKLMILFISVGILLFLSVGCILAAKYVVPLYKAAKGLNQDKNFKEEDVKSNFDDNSEAAEHMEGYINIAVFGIDTRARNESTSTQIDDSDSRSDVIMIISVNTDTKEVKLLSVYRDTYLFKEKNSKGDTFDKINHAYAKGKAANALSLINQNLDLDIKDYVTVDFSIVAQAIDAVGGVEIDLESKEIEKYNKDGSYAQNYPLLNHYIDEINQLTGSDSPHIDKPGTYLMDGVQATAFGRIRYCDTDYERTARQREVLMKLFEKAKSQGISKLLQIAQMVTPQVITSLDFDEITKLAKYALNCNIVDQQGFPFNQESGKVGATDYVFSENLTKDVSQLHYYLFNKENYTPTSRVQEISDEIDAKRGKKKSSSSGSTSSPATTKNPATHKPVVTATEETTHNTSNTTSNTTTSNTSSDTTTQTNTSIAEVTSAPEPVETEAPVQTQAPVKTQAPVQTQAPVKTQAPVQTQAPVKTQAPVQTQTPDEVNSDEDDAQ